MLALSVALGAVGLAAVGAVFVVARDLLARHFELETRKRTQRELDDLEAIKVEQRALRRELSDLALGVMRGKR